MCGIAGFLNGGNQGSSDAAINELNRMAETIHSRGPDDFGSWYGDPGIGLAHRRLSIIDLSHAGHQPMSSHCDRYVIVFNGEIYNHLDLRNELKHFGSAPPWRGHSDTETLLFGFAAWGIRATIERCIGMFAFGVWDKSSQVLTIGRDRLGEKPLYYGWQGSGHLANFLFGSEVKAIKAHTAFSANINRDALGLYVRHNNIPAPYTIYEGIYKLQPGHLLTVSLTKPAPILEQYWSLPEVAVAGVADPFKGTTEQATFELETLLMSAVHQQMMSDVPIGAFLSGGIDSSTIVALMQKQSSRPVKTFTIGFSEKGYNEADHAKAVAKHLGTDHTELYVNSQQALDVIPRLPKLYCEPFSDSSQIPTFLVSQLARQHVTVSLSGDAGDELFAGYNRHVMTSNVWGKLRRIPTPLRRLAAAGMRSLSPNDWNATLGQVVQWLPQKLHMANMGNKLHKSASVLGAQSVNDLYLGLVTHWSPDNLVLGCSEPPTYLRGLSLALDGLNDVQRMMVVDTLTYLPDDILVKVDRAAMGVSLESRVPFLDHRVVEFAWRLPLDMKLRDGVGKWILREVLYRHVPQKIIDRPKMGFGVPIDSWLRGPLRDWAENLLDESRLRQEGFFNPKPIRQKWAEHLSGKRNWQHHLWVILMFQAWLESQSEG